MKKIVLIALVLLVTVGCAETTEIAPTAVPVEVDEPSFAEGQATALTIEKIKDDLAFVANNGWGEDIEITLICNKLNNKFIFRTQFSSFTEESALYNFTEEYQGLGVWLVQLDNFKWQVYESTATVRTIGTYEASTANRNKRITTRHVC